MRQKLLVVLIAAMLVLAGCSGATGPGNSGEPSDGTSGDATGTISFYISDQQNAIDDFEHLNVTVTMVGFHRAGADDENENETEVTDATEAEDENETDAAEPDEPDEREGWEEFEMNETTVDLTELQGANATLVEQFEVPNGTYDKVFVYVSEVNGTLKDGSQPDVMLPSNKLQLNKQFSVGDGEEVSFVYDITVIKRGQSGSYNIKPVAGESGTDQPISEVDDEDEGEGDDEADEREQGQQNRRDDEETATTTDTEESLGQMDFYVSDQQNAIGDFEHLNVTITEVGLQQGGESGNWTTYEIDDATVDLTALQGTNATMLAQLDVEAGTYTKVFIHVSEVNGTLTDGNAPDVKLPSERLQLNKEFEVGANESVDFVYDVTVIKRGQSGSYNLKPVVSESGTDQPIREVDDENEDNETERDDQNDADDAEATDLDATFVSDVYAGENATVRVTVNGSAVANATVTYDGTAYTTDANGEVTFTVPNDAEEVEVVVAYNGAEVELGKPVESGSDEQETATPTPTSDGGS